MAYFIILLTVFIFTPAMAQTILFDDFTDKPAERWEFITDQVMGGVSTGNVSFMTEEGPNYARMTGTVSLQNNGGFIQFRRRVTSHFEKSKLRSRIKIKRQ